MGASYVSTVAQNGQAIFKSCIFIVDQLSHELTTFAHCSDVLMAVTSWPVSRIHSGADILKDETISLFWHNTTRHPNTHARARAHITKWNIYSTMTHHFYSGSHDTLMQQARPACTRTVRRNVPLILTENACTQILRGAINVYKMALLINVMEYISGNTKIFSTQINL